jgi:hypothetical protein
MADSHVFAVQDAGGGETGFCSVLGALDEVLALLVYVGVEGLRAHQRIIDIEPDPIELDWVHEMHCLRAEFVWPRELNDHDREILELADVKVLKGRCNPQFVSMLPGFAPWQVSGAEAEFLTVMLEQAVLVCGRVRDNPDLLESPEESVYLTRVPISDGSTIFWEDRWLKHVPHKVEPEMAPLDPGALDDLRKLAGRTRGAWEADFFYAPTPIQEEERYRPWMPQMAMIADRDSGMVVRAEMFKDRPGPDSLRGEMVRQILAVSSAPEEICVRRFEVYSALEGLARMLGSRLRLLPTLPAIRDARQSFMGALTRDEAEESDELPLDESGGVPPERIGDRPGGSAPPLETPLAEDELMQLHGFLASDAVPAGTLWLDGFDGLAAALRPAPG